MTKDKFVVDLYIRVSTDRQAKEGDSLEEQESELKKFCDYRNFQIHKIYIEKGKSGGNTNRPEYKKLVKDIEVGKIDAVVVKKLDRLSRSLLDFEQLMVMMQSNNVEFISLRENFDTTMAMGKAMLRVALVFAQLEREQTAERIKDVFAYRAEQGLFNGGTRPYGYDSVSKELVPQKQEKKVIEFMFQTFIKTKSTTITARECNAMGFRTRKGSLWDKRQMHKILNNPVYTGKIRWNGIVSEGIQQPLVSQEVFEKAQFIFSKRTYVRDNKKIKGLLKGLLYFEDENNPMTPNYTKKKTKLYYYYRCISSLNPKLNQTPKRCLPMEQTNEDFLEFVLGLADESKLRGISKQVDTRNHHLQAQSDAFQAEIEGFEKKLEEVKNKKEKYLDSLISNQFTGSEREAINAKISDFTIQEKQLKGHIFKLEFSKSEKLESLVSMEDFKDELVYLKLNYDAMGSPELREWLHKNVSTIIYKEEVFKVYLKLLDLWVG
jgi:site-specific DNA recombinase